MTELLGLLAFCTRPLVELLLAAEQNMFVQRTLPHEPTAPLTESAGAMTPAAAQSSFLIPNSLLTPLHRMQQHLLQQRRLYELTSYPKGTHWMLMQPRVEITLVKQGDRPVRSVSIYQSITCMEEYERKSFEELRIEDETGSMEAQETVALLAKLSVGLMQEDDSWLPSHWESINPAHGNTSLVLLRDDNPKHAAELAEVKRHWNQTGGLGPLLSVYRIQNAAQLVRFNALRSQLQLRDGIATQDIVAYHGTRANNPELIYASSTGFDMQRGVAMPGSENSSAQESSLPRGSRLHISFTAIMSVAITCCSFQWFHSNAAMDTASVLLNM